MTNLTHKLKSLISIKTVFILVFIGMAFVCADIAKVWLADQFNNIANQYNTNYVSVDYQKLTK